MNATGVVLHTNLGRAPLAERAIARIVEVARGYSNLEYKLAEGERGSRHAHVARLAAGLCGAEAALVVNNGAAAVLLALSSLAAGREVIVSRGELVEIGGSFRIPDVLRASGARLVEVGTTNRTHLRDYERAITSDTALLLKVHRSNFAVVGFTTEVPVSELAQLAAARGIATCVDLGSGSLQPTASLGLPAEPTAPEVVAEGADVVTFSGDKLLGGPQAGLILCRNRSSTRCAPTRCCGRCGPTSSRWPRSRPRSSATATGAPPSRCRPWRCSPSHRRRYGRVPRRSAARSRAWRRPAPVPCGGTRRRRGWCAAAGRAAVDGGGRGAPAPLGQRARCPATRRRPTGGGANRGQPTAARRANALRS